MRTFALVSLLGGVPALSGNAAVVALGVLTAYGLGDRKDPGLTGEVALVAMLALGVLAQTRPAVAFESAVPSSFFHSCPTARSTPFGLLNPFTSGAWRSSPWR